MTSLKISYVAVPKVETLFYCDIPKYKLDHGLFVRVLRNGCTVSLPDILVVI